MSRFETLVKAHKANLTTNQHWCILLVSRTKHRTQGDDMSKIQRQEHNEFGLKKANTVTGFTNLIKMITDLLTIWVV